jgi:indolepyruvate ferredoxin oxidoreductase, beta subunit
VTETVTNILMVGVGGQGIILASDILADSLMEAGFDVKKSEVHGMAQRGGSVSSHIRFGKKVYSPLIARRQVDILFCLEMLEALRSINFLNAKSLVILNDYRLNPPSVSLGVEQYPEGIHDIFNRYFSRVALIDGVALAKENGNPRTMGIIILGYLSRYLDVPQDIWESVIRRRVPKKVVDVNVSAFEIGRRTDHIR